MRYLATLALALAIGCCLLLHVVVRLLVWLWQELCDELERMAQGE